MTRKSLLITFLILAATIIVVPSILVANGTVNLNVGPSTTLITEQKFDKTFEKIKISIEADIIITQKDQDSIKIEASKNQTPRIKISQTSRTISVDTKNEPLLDIKLLNEDTRPKIFVSMKDAKEIEISGKSRVQIQKYKTDNLNIIFNSEGSFIADNLEVGSLQITQSLSGFVNLKGKAEDLSIYSSNSARSLLRFFSVKNAKINSQGSGAIELDVSDNLDVNISGSSPVRYQGVPTITKQINGEGNLSSF